MRGISWDNVKCFIATARAGSLTVAASTLKVSPATLSRRLSTLETEHGRLLFARTPAGYVLTKDGRNFLEACEKIEHDFAILESLIETEGNEPSGMVRVAVSENIANLILLPRLASFIERNPLIEVEFLTGSQSIPLHGREADLAIRLSVPESGAFKVRTVGTLHHALYASASVVSDHNADVLGIIGWSEGNEELPIAMSSTSHPLYHKNPKVRVSSLQGHVSAALAGLGAAYLPCIVGDVYSDLIRIDGPKGYLRQDIYLIMHDDNIEIPQIRVVADFLVKAIGEASDALSGTQ